MVVTKDMVPEKKSVQFMEAIEIEDIVVKEFEVFVFKMEEVLAVTV